MLKRVLHVSSLRFQVFWRVRYNVISISQFLYRAFSKFIILFKLKLNIYCFKYQDCVIIIRTETHIHFSTGVGSDVRKLTNWPIKDFRRLLNIVHDNFASPKIPHYSVEFPKSMLRQSSHKSYPEYTTDDLTLSYYRHFVMETWLKLRIYAKRKIIILDT